MSYGSGHKRRAALKEKEGEFEIISESKVRKVKRSNYSSEDEIMFNSSDDVPMFRAIIKTSDAGAIIGKSGENIKRIRAEYSVNMSIPDSSSPERVLIIKGEIDKICQIILEILPLFEDYRNNEDLNFEAEIRMLVIAGYVGAIMGSAGSKIKSLREETGASIKVYEDCCPYSHERVFRINGTPNVLVEVIKRILEVVQESSANRPQKETIYYDPSKTASPDFPSSDMQSRLAGGYGGRSPQGYGGVSGGGSMGGSGGRGHYGSSFGSGDVGFRDSQSARNRTGGTNGHRMGAGGGAGTGGGGGRNNSLPMHMMDGGQPPAIGAAFGGIGDMGPAGAVGGHGYHASAYGAAPNAFRHGPEFAIDGSEETRTMKVSIKNEDAGAVIGPKGATINRVRERSGCTIKIDDGRGPESIRGQRIITITGSEQQIQFAQYLMQQSVKQDQGRFDRNSRSGVTDGRGGGGGNRR